MNLSRHMDVHVQYGLPNRHTDLKCGGRPGVFYQSGVGFNFENGSCATQLHRINPKTLIRQAFSDTHTEGNKFMEFIVMKRLPGRQAGLGLRNTGEIRNCLSVYVNIKIIIISYEHLKKWFRNIIISFLD